MQYWSRISGGDPGEKDAGKREKMQLSSSHLSIHNAVLTPRRSGPRATPPF